MSGECDKCGEHCLDCNCGPDISDVAIRDKLCHINGLVVCYHLLHDKKIIRETHAYADNPSDYLYIAITDEITKLEKDIERRR